MTGQNNGLDRQSVKNLSQNLVKILIEFIKNNKYIQSPGKQ